MRMPDRYAVGEKPIIPSDARPNSSTPSMRSTSPGRGQKQHAQAITRQPALKASHADSR